MEKAYTIQERRDQSRRRESSKAGKWRAEPTQGPQLRMQLQAMKSHHVD
jgi:hypothetical protein